MSDAREPEVLQTTGELYELMTRQEPLLPELEEHVYEDPMFGRVLKHPLVFAVPLHSPAMANRQYVAKQAAVDKAFSEGKLQSYVWLHERPYRADALLHLLTLDKLNVPLFDSDDDYWDLIGSVWTDSENIWQNREIWDMIFRTERPRRMAMMSNEEQEFYAALPHRLTVYRGCQRDLNEDGLSWTLDAERALWFAKRLEKENACVIVGTVRKRDTIAYFNGRNEQEIVVHPDAEMSIVSYIVDGDDSE